MSPPDATKPRIGFWLRVISALVDASILCIVWFIFWGLWSVFQNRNPSKVELNSVFLLLYFFYTITEILWAATPGKMLLRQCIGRSDGQKADGWRLFLRWSVKQSPPLFQIIFGITGLSIFYLLEGFGSLVVLVGFLYASTDDKQAWHDQWAGTAVYRRRDWARTSTSG